MNTNFAILKFPAVVLLCGLLVSGVFAQEKPSSDKKATQELVDVKLSGGAVSFRVPAEWKKVERGSRITEMQLEIAAAEGDKEKSVLTFTRAMGSVEANVDRWMGQFKQADGGSTKDKAKVKKEEIGGETVTMVDVSGTFMKRMGGGPFAGGEVKAMKDYRMLAAIIPLMGDTKYFVKLYGPMKTIEQNKKKFEAMMKSLNVAK